MGQDLAATTAQQPATLEQLTLEVKFYLGQTAQNIIEVGKRLTQAKEMVPHGEWQDWLKDNFGLSQESARKFMKIADRFGKSNTSWNLNQSQMFELLALPADETKVFIEAKATAGTPVENMTIKTLREEVQQWKSKAEVNANAVTEKEKTVSKMAIDFNNLQREKSQLQRSLDDARSQLQNQKSVIQAPADYEQIKRELAKLRDEKFSLQKKLETASREVKVPADYYANKKQLAKLDSQIKCMQEELDAKTAEVQRRVTAEEYYVVAQKFDTISNLVREIFYNKQLGAVIEEYRRNKKDRFEQIVALFSDFARSYKN